MYDITSLRRCPVVNRSFGIIRQYRDVEHKRKSRFDSLVRRGVFQKKNEKFTFRCKELTRDFNYFERSFQYEEQTDLDTESRATDHPQELRELHQKTQLILF